MDWGDEEVGSLWEVISPNSFGDLATSAQPVRRSHQFVHDVFESEDEASGERISWVDYTEQEGKEYCERDEILLDIIADEALLLKAAQRVRGRWRSDQRRIVNLRTLASDLSGLLFLANERGLEDAEAFQGENYSQIRHESRGPKPLDRNEKLVKITDMPNWAQPAFKGIQQLNSVQSQVYETAVSTVSNILLCAPPGSGKTIVALLTILRQLELNKNLGGTYDRQDSKVVYLSPMKALVAQLVRYLSDCLQHCQVTVSELRGDHVENAQIIVTTPEDWDIFIRTNHSFSQLVKLVILDDIHLLHHTRGPVLEAIVARTILQIKGGLSIRLVGLSPTLQNSVDLARFLQAPCLFVFDCGYRPVQRLIQFPDYEVMANKCPRLVLDAAKKHQVLVFVCSLCEATLLANSLRNTALKNMTTVRKGRKLTDEEIKRVESPALKYLLPHGFAVLGDELTRGDRQIVNQLFEEKLVQVLITTVSAIWGLNLGASTVVIIGTQFYNPEKGNFVEMSCMEITKMLGAGRRQFDHESGSGVILTTSEEKSLYHQSLMTDQLRMESQFVSKLVDQLNAEIVLGTVKNATIACDWLCRTFFYYRMQRYPNLYGLLVPGNKALEGRIADLIHSAATILDKKKMVIYDRKSGNFQVTELGRIASRYRIAHETIATFNMNSWPSNIGICRVFSLSEELKHVAVQTLEKGELISLSESDFLDPIEEAPEKRSSKINILLQAYLSNLHIESHTLRSDMVYIAESVERLAPALREVLSRRGRGFEQLAKQAMDMTTKIRNKKMIDDIPTIEI